MARSSPLAAAVGALLVVTGCSAPGPAVVPEPRLMALQRDHYVLPPEPPPPPRPWWSDDERRALEAEWPPVDALSTPPPPPPDGPREVAPRFGRARPSLPGRPDLPFFSQVRGAPGASEVLLRATPPPRDGPSRVILVLEAR